MRETKEQILCDLQEFKGYMRMPRVIQKSNKLSASDKYVAALIFSYSNTKKEGSTCTRTYKGFSEELGISCATTSRAFKRLAKYFKGAIDQPRRATYRFNRNALTSSSYIIEEHYFRKKSFLLSDNSTFLQLSRHAAQAAPIFYERFFNDAKDRPWEQDARQKLAIHAPMPVSELSKLIGTSEKTAAEAISELLQCGIIFTKSKYKQLNGYFCRDFKPDLKLFEAIIEVRAMQKKYDLTKAQEQAQIAEQERKKRLEIEREQKIKTVRKLHEAVYKPLFNKQHELLNRLIATGGNPTAEEEKEMDDVKAKINKLDERYINSG